MTSIVIFILSVIQFLVQKFSKNQKYIMYQGITFTSIYITILGMNSNIGIYISFGLVPFISCMYLSRSVVIYSCALGYSTMLIAVLGRAFHVAAIDSYHTVEPLSWFLPMAGGFTIEFLFVVLFTTSLAKLLKRTIKQYQEKSRKIEIMQNKLIQAFANIVEWSDQYTGDHIKRTSKYVQIISEQLVKSGYYTDILTPETIKLYAEAAPLHDIGKINIPNNILSKPGKFTPEEYEIMKTHSRTGYEIITKDLKELENPEYIEIASQMALYHHERWDGSGYPNGISGKDIPLCGRIMAAADVLDALLSKRQYKEAFNIDTALSFYESGRGQHFEPCISDAVLLLKDEIIKISQCEA